VFTEAEVEELRKRAQAGGATVPVCLPTAADLEAQAAGDHEQEQADRDYREVCRLALANGAGACRCHGAEKAPCLSCRVARWLAVGL
jgi:hypothetical protein